MTTEKVFQGYVILNWKNGSFRAVKKLTKGIKDTEIPIQLDIKVLIPDRQEMKVSGELELSGTKVKKLILDALEDGDFNGQPTS